MCVYPCTHVPMHLCTHAPVHLCTQEPMNLCTQEHMYPCTYAPRNSCTYAPMHPGTHVPMHMRTEVNFFRMPFILVLCFEAGSLTSLKLTKQSRLTGQESSYFCLLGTEITNEYHPPHWAFYVGCGD